MAQNPCTYHNQTNNSSKFGNKGNKTSQFFFSEKEKLVFQNHFVVFELQIVNDMLYLNIFFGLVVVQHMVFFKVAHFAMLRKAIINWRSAKIRKKNLLVLKFSFRDQSIKWSHRINIYQTYNLKILYKFYIKNICVVPI